MNTNWREKIRQIKPWKIITGLALLVFFIFAIFFFSYYKAETVEVLGNVHYTEDEVKEMVLRGAFASNTILAPRLCSREVRNVPYVDSFNVTRLGRHTLCINVKEKKLVGCVPYLDSYVYFDRNGIFVESSAGREKQVPYFGSLQLAYAIKYEKLPLKGSTVLNTAITLATIFQKNEMIPDTIVFDQTYQIYLIYGDITVQLGKDENLEDKMARVIAILPKLEGEKGILHMENVTDKMKTVTFERDLTDITAENWTGGYDKNGEYTGDGPYDEKGRYVGPRPTSEYEYALEAWPGGYDEDGDFTG
ncbi:MAG: cell division protein FtsQ/DivIB, partial [Blautia sp.]|nr:cell division protein FtsQ/DivIB [Blautia sp.]